MAKIKVIYDADAKEFESQVQYFLNLGYEVKSCFCGLYTCVDGSSDPSYKAILIKEQSNE